MTPARPMPELLPVMKMMLPGSFMAFVLLSSGRGVSLGNGRRTSAGR